jgi:repressor LexA
MYSRIKLTPRQAEVLGFLNKFQFSEKIPPTYREIADHFGFKSTKAAADHIAVLEKKGYVRRHCSRSRGIELIAPSRQIDQGHINVPILGNIPAGAPEQKTEYRDTTIGIDVMLLGGIEHHRLFAVQVKGDSMIGRGIYDGDWVIADADAEPRMNDVVVALIDGENTLKTLDKKKDAFYLKSENPDYNDWAPINELTIQGTARVLMRRI